MLGFTLGLAARQMLLLLLSFCSFRRFGLRALNPKP